jgi:hypothetical protein
VPYCLLVDSVVDSDGANKEIILVLGAKAEDNTGKYGSPGLCSHCIALHCTYWRVLYTALTATALHCTVPPSTTLHSQLTPLHRHCTGTVKSLMYGTALPYTAVQRTALCRTALHCSRGI